MMQDVSPHLETRYEPKDQGEVALNIVVVGGLAAEWNGSLRWRTRKEELAWLEHRLPQRIPKARILAFRFGNGFGTEEPFPPGKEITGIGGHLLSVLRDQFFWDKVYISSLP
ncbi:hypothetical protein AbraIFM66950_001569 [Aspergillus brasiliensis]|nr:hypothetical protein AbraIFM66950_001569 [Aspergillus brasiliensis]